MFNREAWAKAQQALDARESSDDISVGDCFIIPNFPHLVLVIMPDHVLFIDTLNLVSRVSVHDHESIKVSLRAGAMVKI